MHGKTLDSVAAAAAADVLERDRLRIVIATIAINEGFSGAGVPGQGQVTSCEFATPGLDA